MLVKERGLFHGPAAGGAPGVECHRLVVGMWLLGGSRSATGETHDKSCAGQYQSGNRRHHRENACGCDKEHSNQHLDEQGDTAARSAGEIEMEES
jgi:hypothetical protein